MYSFMLTSYSVIIFYLKPKTSQADSAILNAEHIAAELRFDRYLAQCSLALDCIADTLITIIPSSSQIFVGLSCLSSFTSGGNPAIHSLGAVCLHAAGFSSEVGALFGGLAVLSALAHIISVGVLSFICLFLCSSLCSAFHICFYVRLDSGVLPKNNIRSSSCTFIMRCAAIRWNYVTTSRCCNS
jgi:hypothetical protein